MATSKTYSISGDFTSSGGKVSDTLTPEIQASAVKVALDHIDTDGDDCHVEFKGELDAADIVALDALVAAHLGNPLPKAPEPVILEPTGDSAKALVMHGREFEAELDSDTPVEISWAEDRDVQGASFQLANTSPGDWIRLAIVAPGGGGPEIRVLAEGGESGDEGVPIPPSGSFAVVSEGTALLEAGVPVRITYHSTATEGTKPKVWVVFRMWR